MILQLPIYNRTSLFLLQFTPAKTKILNPNTFWFLGRYLLLVFPKMVCCQVSAVHFQLGINMWFCSLPPKQKQTQQTPWKINGWNLQIIHFFQGKWSSKPNLQGILFQVPAVHLPGRVTTPWLYVYPRNSKRALIHKVSRLKTYPRWRHWSIWRICPWTQINPSNWY